MADGLSNSSVHVIVQDKYGFIWIATENGLNVYNGIQFDQIYPKDSDGNLIAGNSFFQLILDEDSVWIGSSLGLCKIHVISKKGRKIDIGGDMGIPGLLLDKDKDLLWIGTRYGLSKYQISTGAIQQFNTTNSNISNDLVREIYKDSDDNIWVGTFDKLNKLLPNSNVFEVIDIKQNYRPSINNDLILSISPKSKDNDTLLWIGTQTGLVLYNRYSSEMKYFREENSDISNSTSKTVYSSEAGDVWVGTDFGLVQMNADFDMQIHLHNPNKRNTITNSTIWEIFEDRSNALWFGTSNGVSVLSKSGNRFQFFPMTFMREGNEVGYDVWKMMEDLNGDYWLGTQFGAVHYNPEKNLYETFNSEQVKERKLEIDGTKCFLEDNKGRLWIGTNGGIVLYKKNNRGELKLLAKFNSNNGLRSNYINEFYELDNGEILVNTYLGLHKVIENTKGVQFEFIKETGSIQSFKHGFLWSYQVRNLNKIHPETFEMTTEVSFALEDEKNKIQSLCFSDDNKVWVGIIGGIICYDLTSKEYDLFKMKTNKPFPIINIQKDDQGNIWGSSYSAIVKLYPETRDFEIYPIGNEIPISRFSQQCGFKSKNGDVVFGGLDGFVRFSPNRITKSDYHPQVFITKLSLSNQEILTGQKYNGRVILDAPVSFIENLKLNYAERTLSLEFSALQYGNRNGIRYAYKLDGEDTEWNYLNQGNGQVSYSGLSAGKYTFRVKGSNTDGVWNEDETLLHISIKPPMWASPFIIAIYLIIIFAIVYWLIFYYKNRAKMLNQLKIVQLEKEYSENIAKAKHQFFTNISHEFRTPLSLIIGPAEKLIQDTNIDSTGKKFAILIEKNARRLLWLNNQLLDFGKLENKTVKLCISKFDMSELVKNVFLLFQDKAERKNINYSFYTDFDKLEVEMDLRKIETILFNLISNAFKFTAEKGEISLLLSSCQLNTENAFCIVVKDTGIGIAKQDQKKIFERFFQTEESIKMKRGSGIGLSLVNEYVNMHKGEVVLKSEINIGSEFKISFPLQINYPDSLIVETLTDESLLKIANTENTKVSVVDSLSGNPYILLLEDDKEIVEFIRLSFYGKYNVKVATNGKIAFQMIGKHLPDLVISDVVMPEMDGLEFTRKFKSNPKTAHIPLILLTGQSHTKQQLEGLKSGADAYFTKPFEIDLLEVRIANFLRRSENMAKYLLLDKLSKPHDIEMDSQDEKMIRKVVSCIEKHIANENLSIELVCKETGFSHSILYRKIKKLSGQTVNEFIRTVRIRRAEQLLRSKKHSVSEVMLETGFSHHSYFSKCFRKLYGVSPKEYMEQV
jgi:signal transduction histidine kinase/ligand-binding sensor domain-containing protein/DNA-binding response OmpR family regulator